MQLNRITRYSFLFLILSFIVLSGCTPGAQVEPTRAGGKTEGNMHDHEITSEPESHIPTDEILQPTKMTTDQQNCGDFVEYSNNDYGFMLCLPHESPVVSEEFDKVRIDLPFQPQTNLREKYLQIDIQDQYSKCSTPLAKDYVNGDLPGVTRELNGIEFVTQTVSEGAVGSFYEWNIYSTVCAETCLSFNFLLVWSNAQNYSPPLQEFDRNLAASVFDEIMMTYECFKE